MGLGYRSLFPLMVVLAGMAHADDALLEAPRWRFFSDPQEISSLYINDLVQEIGGNVWLATDRGLVRYDGTRFTHVEVPDVPPDARYNCLLYSADGTVWVGTSVGVVRYIAHEWDYPIRSGNVTALTESADGTVWIGISPSLEARFSRDVVASRGVYTNTGVYTYEHGKWLHYGPGDGIPASPVHTLYGDQEGGVWAIFGSSRRMEGLYRFRNGRWTDMVDRLRPPDGDILTIAQTRDGAYWFGTYGRGIWRWQGERWETFEDEPDVHTFTAASLLPMPDGSVWAVGSPAGTMLKFSEGRWLSYPIRQVGITGRLVSKVVYVLDDAFWFLIPGRGVARFDRRGGPWWIYDQKHGLRPTGSVSIIAQGADQTVWVGTTAGLMEYDGTGFVVPPVAPYVSDQEITAMLVWPNGNLWIASGSPTSIPGIWQFDGKTWAQLATTPILDGQASIQAMLRARNGDVWVGTGSREGSGGYGVFQFHHGRWLRYTTENGLANDQVLSLAEDTLGGVWVGTPEGVSRYDGHQWRTFTEAQGLFCTYAWAICAASDGAVWVGGNQPNAGLSRYFNGGWTHITADSGLASDDVWSIVEAEDHSIWVGTARGVSQYNGKQWFTFRAENGLAKDQVWAAALLEDGSLWFGHFDGAITEYHATSSDPPRTTVEPLPKRVAHPGFLTVRWWGNDRWDRTLQGDLLYSWRIDGGAWSSYSKLTSHTFTTLPSGTHTFQVVAMDQEGNTDISGEGAIFVVDPPFWLTWWFLFPTALGTIGIVVAGSIAYQRNRQWKRAQAQLVGELQRELQVAQRLQAELLPQSDPVVPGFEITGLCKPASRVGGDYFTYLWVSERSSRVGVVVADVTGHAMQAAIPAVLFSGMLATVTRHTTSPAEILTVLNESLLTRTGTHTFICCTIAAFDLPSRMLYLANAGGLDPIRQRNGTVDLLEVQGDRLPLGMITDVKYVERVIPFAPGDMFVVLTDGLVEAKSPDGELFGFERVVESIARSNGVRDVREQLLNEVAVHMASREQDDDITLLVVRIGLPNTAAAPDAARAQSLGVSQDSA